jgi:plastocyanin
MREVQSLIVLCAALALAAPARAANQPVAFGGSAGLNYSPKDFTIKTGDTATLTGDFTQHPLVWDASEFATTNTGSSNGFSFTQPGDHPFHCSVHQSLGMVGVVHVVADQHPARVSFSAAPAYPSAGQPVTFTYSGDPDPDGTLVRWEWDLDGDGTFEAATPAGAATTTYARPGTVTVQMRAVDDSNEASAAAAQAVTIAPAGGSAGAGGGASGGRDTTAPRATLVKLRGLKLTFRASERASATASLRARGKTVARGSAKAKSGTISIRLRLTKAGRSLLPHGRRVRAKLTLTLRDAAGNRATVTRQLRVRRP